ncbi:excisionase family DNA binding protein [Amycolatopsis sulphurea]|uniref:Excisionase family DNA binding protein n=1 Tax=Amycolatopsis sulphurea TaxID=76022 RepID=A0A2A9FD45_9PSEU|nr:helix-turn-helix domain-containing protein [Amycolatopsis sulphurea]PFG48671.1 excisionase family DNA binding protein [Amycolatopsis sulphurea]
MQVEGNAVFRVKALAELLDVSRSTVYRAIEAGQLEALKIGSGRGALRIPGFSVNIWLSDCMDAAAAEFFHGDASAEQADNPESETGDDVAESSLNAWLGASDEAEASPAAGDSAAAGVAGVA